MPPSLIRGVGPRRAAGVTFVIVCLSVLGSGQPTAQTPTRPVTWEGTLTATITEDFARQPNPFADGVWTATFNVTVKWSERKRVDVTDASGRTVGQLVLLADDGSRWNGEASGLSRTRRRTESLQLSGSGSGGPVLQTGWVYQSMADDDPLKDLLPNGTYALWTFAEMQVQHVFTATDGSTIVQRSPGEVPPQQMQNAIGTRMPVFFWNERTPAPDVIPADTLRLMMANTLADYPYADQQRRVLADGTMRGSFEARGRESEAGITRSVTWNIARRLGVTGTLNEVDAAWRPKLANEVTVQASIDPAQGVTGRFRFTLFDVSREKGYAMNAGGSGTGLDLRFASTHPQPMGSAKETSDGYTIETDDALQSASVTIASFDYGAWGRLKAEVNVEGQWYALDAAGGGASITVPVDTNGNRIWDTWEKNTGIWGQAASSDDDATPDGEAHGDGFSNFEEYRGFMVGTDWLTLTPALKELFIYDANGEGIGDFKSSGLGTFLIDEQQYDRNRVVNFNRGYASAGAQKGLKIENAALTTPGVLGLVTPTATTPNRVEHVYLDMVELESHGSAAIDSTIAHELGHGVSIEHHGHYTEGRCNGGPRGLIAPWGGAYSGDRGCVMAYSSATYYRAWDGKCYDWTFGSTWGAAFCVTKAGSGINSGDRRVEDGHPLPVSGNATHGDCQHQIRLK